MPKETYCYAKRDLFLCQQTTIHMVKETYSYSKPLLGEYVDQRNSILPKISFMNRNIYKPKPYIQNFGNNFVSNLSIIDLLMCEGPNGKAILQRSKSLSVN